MKSFMHAELPGSPASMCFSFPRVHDICMRCARWTYLLIDRQRSWPDCPCSLGLSGTARFRGRERPWSCPGGLRYHRGGHHFSSLYHGLLHDFCTRPYKFATGSMLAGDQGRQRYRQEQALNEASALTVAST